MNSTATATQLHTMSVPQQYQVTSPDQPLTIPFDKMNFSTPRLCRSICFSAKNIWYSNNHCDGDDQYDGLFVRARETKTLLMPELNRIWATASFWAWDPFGKTSVADASLTVELRMAGYPRDENGVKMIALYPSIWLRTADKVVRASDPWKEIEAVVRRLRLDSPQNARIYVEGGGRISDDSVSVAKEYLTMDKGITFRSGEALYIHVLAKPERSSACGLICLITIIKDEVVLEQNISRIGGLITSMLPRQAVTSGHVMTRYFLKFPTRNLSSNALPKHPNSLAREENGRSDNELVENYESDHDPEQSLGYVNVNGSTDWLSVTPSDTINFIVQLAKGSVHTSEWSIDTSRPIPADFALLSDIADWERENYYVDPPAEGIQPNKPTGARKWVSGYNNDESLRAGEVLIVVNEESDSLVASLQPARIPLIIGSSTLWTRKVRLQAPLAPGTSGSWVIDRKTGALCGSIIVVYDGEPFALMITAEALFADIKTYSSMTMNDAKFPAVSEPSRSEVQDSQPVLAKHSPEQLSLEVDSITDGQESDASWSPFGSGSPLGSCTTSLKSSIFVSVAINGRTYQGTDAKYWAPKDQLSLDMMEVLYYATFLALESKLYLAPLETSHVSNVLDIGTGAGMWAIDFADDFPEAKVTGTDIAPVQPSFVPPNLQFEIEDFTKEWTFEAERDFIHMRFLGGSVSDWRHLYEKAFRTTKPGGWIETHEFNLEFHSQNESIADGSAIATWGTIFEEGCKRLGTSFIPLPSDVQAKHLEAVGFVDIQSRIIKVPIGTWPKERNLKKIGGLTKISITEDIQGWIGFMTHICGWKNSDIEEYCVQLSKELASTTAQLFYYQQIVWGRKPEDC
ncbi:mRNA 3 -end-processing YTH1 [Fusarium agapanthi]|uniref:mRNA 3 -end-processing YTH1 n=1 Tax=Fusarium agapanthi TaxID=1803897 RepID=A0A9P5B4F7_9HYPO|nr:mRNA 3 -end-processing YTH1 [Fusarium agapanthi]